MYTCWMLLELTRVLYMLYRSRSTSAVKLKGNSWLKIFSIESSLYLNGEGKYFSYIIKQWYNQCNDTSVSQNFDHSHKSTYIAYVTTPYFRNGTFGESLFCVVLAMWHLFVYCYHYFSCVCICFRDSSRIWMDGVVISHQCGIILQVYGDCSSQL